MADFNSLIDEFANLVAERVVAKLEARPLERDFAHSVEIANNAAVISDSAYEVFSGELEKKEYQVGDTVSVGGVEFTKHSDIPFENQDDTRPGKVSLAKTPTVNRLAELTKISILPLRKLISAAEGKAVGDYAGMKKPELVKYIIDFEGLTGRLVDQVEPEVEEVIPDDDSVDDEPADDDEEVELDRESALTLDLAELKSIAVENDIDPSLLKGLDVDAVVDLLFGSESDEVAAVEPASNEAEEDEGEEKEITLEDIPGLSLAELKQLADQFDVEYTRKTTQKELAKILVETLDSEVNEE